MSSAAPPFSDDGRPPRDHGISHKPSLRDPAEPWPAAVHPDDEADAELDARLDDELNGRRPAHELDEGLGDDLDDELDDSLDDDVLDDDGLGDAPHDRPNTRLNTRLGDRLHGRSLRGGLGDELHAGLNDGLGDEENDGLDDPLGDSQPNTLKDGLHDSPPQTHAGEDTRKGANPGASSPESSEGPSAPPDREPGENPGKDPHRDTSKNAAPDTARGAGQPPRRPPLRPGMFEPPLPLPWRLFSGARNSASTPPRPIEPVRGVMPWVLWVVLFFFLTYFETQSVGGLKYAVLWRLAVFGPALFIVWTRPLPPGAKSMAPLFWAYLAFCVGPIWGISLGIPDAAYSVNLTANRLFVPVMLMALMGLRWYPVADISVRAFPLFLCLVSIPLLTGILPPVGLQWSLAAVSGLDLTAYNSVFQNQHSASLAHAIAGICAFTLAARFPGRRAYPYMALALGCFGLCVLTTARAGLLGMILGLILVAIYTKRTRLLIAPVALIIGGLLVTAMARPEMIKMIENRLTGQTLYTKGASADTLTSGRLTLQSDAFRGWLGSEPMQMVFGVGREGTKNNNERLNGSHLIAHSAFVDELSAYGLVGFASLMLTLGMAYRLAWRNAKLGYPAGLGSLVALCIFGSLQAMDYSFQNMIIGMVLVLETRAAEMKQKLLAHHTELAAQKTGPAADQDDSARKQSSGTK